jgi:hypothetical protein
MDVRFQQIINRLQEIFANEGVILNADDLAKVGDDTSLLKTAVETFPHPDPRRRKKWAEFADISDTHKCWRQVSLVGIAINILRHT